MTVRRYDVHGHAVSVFALEEDVGLAIDRRLRHFATAAGGGDELRFEVAAAGNGRRDGIPRPQGRARSVIDLPRGEAAYFDELDVFYLELDGVRWRCDTGAGLARGSAGDGLAESAWRVSRLFTVPLLELLKRRGLWAVHAALLGRGGRGLLLAGPSGAGKSTLALLLALAGFDLLGDDTLFLRRDGEGGAVRALAFPDEVDVADTTARLLPELRHLVGAPKRPGAAKHQLAVESVSTAPVPAQCDPAVIVFPRVAAKARSVLRPMSADEALLELVPNVLLTEPESSQAHLDAIGALVGQCSSYRLVTGRDVERLSALVGELLE